jgi:hypothetical protein
MLEKVGGALNAEPSAIRAVLYLVVTVVACCAVYGLGVAAVRHGCAAIVKWRSKRSHSASGKM